MSKTLSYWGVKHTCRNYFRLVQALPIFTKNLSVKGVTVLRSEFVTPRYSNSCVSNIKAKTLCLFLYRRLRSSSILETSVWLCKTTYLYCLWSCK